MWFKAFLEMLPWWRQHEDYLVRPHIYIKYTTLAQESKREWANFVLNARLLSSQAFREMEWFVYSTISQSLIPQINSHQHLLETC